jgi:4-amino-4-deoxy-L-arabinose transferase-like glycosyltransferase
MSRLKSLLIVLAIWATIYLPALGWPEIKGEEGRRILPAIRMLETGDYIVPRVGSSAYFSKPPLINWLVAASFKLFGQRNEWTARAPSVLFVLAVAVAFVTVARGSLGTRGATIAALIWLTNFGMIEKGHLIEIEAVYVSLCALAMICWLSWWEQRCSPWLTWTVPWIFLGLGWLAKGPVHLLFFYAILLAVLWQAKEWKSFFHLAHLTGLFVMLAIFAAWAVPFIEMTRTAQVMSRWSAQFTGRIAGEFFHAGVWIRTFLHIGVYLLPWLLFLPLVRFNKIHDNTQRQLARALAWGSAIPLTFISVMPGALPRYSLPVLTPFCWLMAVTFAENAFAQPGWMNGRDRPLWSRVAGPLAGLSVAIGLIGYPSMAIAIQRRSKVKNVAAQINSAMPSTETLYAVAPNYQPFFFYMHAPVKYVNRVAELPNDTRYFLVLPPDEQAALASQQWAPRHARLILRLTDYRNQTIILFAVEPAGDRTRSD